MKSGLFWGSRHSIHTFFEIFIINLSLFKNYFLILQRILVIKYYGFR